LRYATLVCRVDEVDPPICAKCGGDMRIISVILDPAVTTTILDHLPTKKDADPRAPSGPSRSFDAAS
jgi:hypothetical protein